MEEKKRIKGRKTEKHMKDKRKSLGLGIINVTNIHSNTNNGIIAKISSIAQLHLLPESFMTSPVPQPTLSASTRSASRR